MKCRVESIGSVVLSELGGTLMALNLLYYTSGGDREWLSLYVLLSSGLMQGSPVLPSAWEG